MGTLWYVSSNYIATCYSVIMCYGSYVMIMYIDMLLLQDGNTALHFTCSNGHTEVVQYLLTNGANLSATDKVNHKTIFY